MTRVAVCARIIFVMYRFRVLPHSVIPAVLLSRNPASFIFEVLEGRYYLTMSCVNPTKAYPNGSLTYSAVRQDKLEGIETLTVDEDFRVAWTGSRQSI